MDIPQGTPLKADIIFRFQFTLLPRAGKGAEVGEDGVGADVCTSKKTLDAVFITNVIVSKKPLKKRIFLLYFYDAYDVNL